MASAALPPRSRCQSCHREVHEREAEQDEDIQVAYGQAFGEPGLYRSASMNRNDASSSVFVAGDQLNPPISFDDEDDSIWVHLAQAGSPIKVKFDASTRLGDARKLARLFAASLVESTNTNNASTMEKALLPAPIQFLPNGKVGQTLYTNQEAKQVFVEYPEHMTLSQARVVGDRLARAVQLYKI
jgi:hypothetical protein